MGRIAKIQLAGCLPSISNHFVTRFRAPFDEGWSNHMLHHNIDRHGDPPSRRASKWAGMKGQQARSRKTGSGTRCRFTFLCALLLALLGQSIATQSHVHRRDMSSPAARQGPRISTSRLPAPAPADCPICRESAQAGHYLGPATFQLAPVARAFPPSGVSSLRRIICRLYGFGWRSRAPPIPLHD